MNNIFYSELRKCCNEMYSDRENSEKISKVIEAYDRAILFSDIARKEGLLALEEASEGLDLIDVTQEFLLQSIMLVVDGTDPELVAEIGMNRIVANSFSSFEGFAMLLLIPISTPIQCWQASSMILFLWTKYGVSLKPRNLSILS